MIPHLCSLSKDLLQSQLQVMAGLQRRTIGCKASAMRLAEISSDLRMAQSCATLCFGGMKPTTPLKDIERLNLLQWSVDSFQDLRTLELWDWLLV